MRRLCLFMLIEIATFRLVRKHTSNGRLECICMAKNDNPDYKSERLRDSKCTSHDRFIRLNLKKKWRW